MELTLKQENAIKIIKEKFNNGDRYVTLAGYSGCGKSTAIAHSLDILGVKEEDVVYTSYTGKAVEVLKNFGCANTSTLHHLMYESMPNPDGTFYHRRRKELPYKIVIVDEIGMVPNSIMKDLFRYKNTFFIFSGDNFQLPPVNKNEDNHLLTTPHIFLDEVIRQAADNEIIRLSMNIREGNNINPSDYSKDVKILTPQDISTGLLLWPEQIICATNATRDKYNSFVRDLKHPGLTEPQDGDKMICTRNYWAQESDNEEDDILRTSSLVNGTTGIIHNPRVERIKLPLRTEGYKEMDWLYCDFEASNGEVYSDLYLDYRMLQTGRPTLPWEIQYRLYKKHPEMIPYEFLYGDVISCHKSQGSTFSKVLVLEEGFPYDALEHKRWLYTAVTRPSEKLVLVKKP